MLNPWITTEAIKMVMQLRMISISNLTRKDFTMLHGRTTLMTRSVRERRKAGEITLVLPRTKPTRSSTSRVVWVDTRFEIDVIVSSYSRDELD